MEPESQPSNGPRASVPTLRTVLLPILEDCRIKGAEGVRPHVNFIENDMVHFQRSEWEKDFKSFMDFFNDLTSLLKEANLWVDESGCPPELTLRDEHIIYYAVLLRMLRGCLEVLVPDHSGTTLQNATWLQGTSNEDLVAAALPDSPRRVRFKLYQSGFWRAMYWHREWMASDGVDAVLKAVLPEWNFPAELLWIAEAVMYTEMYWSEAFARQNAFDYASVLLHFWTASTDKAVRDSALTCLGMLTKVTPSVLAGEVCFSLHRLIETDITWQKIEEALLRDLKPKSRTGEYLRHICSVYYHLCIETCRPEAMQGLDTDPHRKLFAAFMAVVRQPLCLGVPAYAVAEWREMKTAFHQIRYIHCVLNEAFGKKKRPKRLPEQHIHSIIALSAECIHVLFTATSDSPWWIPMRDVMARCAWMLREVGKATPKRHTYRYISSAFIAKSSQDATAIVKKNPNPHDAHGQHVNAALAMWMEIVKSLAALEENIDVPPPVASFPPLRRCRSNICLCSVHKPPHHMRVCTGCYKVAYCGYLCQVKDWKYHKDSCAESQMPALN